MCVEVADKYPLLFPARRGPVTEANERSDVIFRHGWDGADQQRVKILKMESRKSQNYTRPAERREDYTARTKETREPFATTPIRA